KVSFSLISLSYCDIKRFNHNSRSYRKFLDKMVSAWFMDDSKEDPRAEHHKNPAEFIDLEGLKQLTGVLYWKLDPERPEADPLLEEIRQERGYSYKDEITCSRETLGSCYEDKLRTFFTEHLHSDEEIRLVLDGS